MLVHFFTPVSKQCSMEWHHKGSPPKKIQDRAVGKIMACVFLCQEEVIHVDFLPHGVTVNVQYYSNLLHNDVHQVIQKKRPRKLSKTIIILHYNTRPSATKFYEGNIGSSGLGNHEPPSIQL
jgi:hypothetical protein